MTNPRRTRRTPHSGWTLLLLLAASATTSAAIAAAGCSESKQPTLSPSGEGSGGGSGSTTTTETDTTQNDKAQKLFEALQDELFDACGSCHDAGGFADTPFLREPRYQSIIEWPDIVRSDAKDSILLTHPVTGQNHGGPNLDSPTYKDTLLPKIEEWLAEEAKTIADVPVEQKGKSIDPFTPILGFNAVYLTPLNGEFEGMAITFNANELTPSALELTDVQVHTTSKLGIHMVHPLVSVHPKGGSPNPDPADSFSNVDQYVDYSSAAALGPGTLILTNWIASGKIQLSFEKIEAYSTLVGDAGADGGLTGGCKDIDAFTTNAQGQFGQCLQCHGGNNGQATAAVDMTGLVNGTDPAGGCGQILNRVNPENPDQSQIFITTDPSSSAAHQFKFGQNQNAFNGFKSSVSVWIAAEK